MSITESHLYVLSRHLFTHGLFTSPHYLHNISNVSMRNVMTCNRNYYGDQIKEDEMDRACSTHGRDENAYKIPDRKPESKRPL